MSVLETKIRKNREHYDVHEPPEGHAERFTAKLDQAFHADKRRTFRINWRAAAAVILIS